MGMVRSAAMSNVIPLKSADDHGPLGAMCTLTLPPSWLAPRLLAIVAEEEREPLRLDIFRGLPNANVTFATDREMVPSLLYRRDAFDLVILQHGGSAFQDAAAVSKALSLPGHPPVVVLYGNCPAKDALTMLQAGAAAVMPRSSGGMALLGAIYLVLNGNRYAPPELLLAPRDDDTQPAPEIVSLSERQRQVARLLAQGLSNKEIARRLDLQEITIKVYVSGIFRKLKVRNRTEAATRLMLNWGG